MNVYCRDHDRSMGVVRLAQGGFPSLEIRHPRWRNHLAAKTGMTGRSNEFYNLREWTGPDVPVRCRDCPGPRMVQVAALLDAFEDGRPKIVL